MNALFLITTVFACLVIFFIIIAVLVARAIIFLITTILAISTIFSLEQTRVLLRALSLHPSLLDSDFNAIPSHSIMGFFSFIRKASIVADHFIRASVLALNPHGLCFQIHALDRRLRGQSIQLSRPAEPPYSQLRPCRCMETL